VSITLTSLQAHKSTLNNITLEWLDEGQRSAMLSTVRGYRLSACIGWFVTQIQKQQR
jgi:hypothetical protein